ncbi:MazG-like family protein [Streptomyces yangpuensis]|uniref:MazG-like family protein n=1 Tax=Streptomyces yangpuensis TaxID=1648182 RepID=UPI00366A527C
MLSTDQWTTIRSLVAWLDSENGRSQHEISMRLLKLVEEAGEVAQAYIGTQGQNPRKGHSHTTDDVAAELCDVIVTAAVALASISDGDPAAIMDAKLKRIADRVGVQ